jgi:uncharacterized coiled-coil protein SlyX
MNNTFQITTTYRLKQLEDKLADTNETLSLLGHRVTRLTLAIEKAEKLIANAKDIQIAVVPPPPIQISPAILSASHRRDLRSVKERWAVWERMYNAGIPPSEISRKFNCDHGSVLYAKRKGFKPAWSCKEKEALVA